MTTAAALKQRLRGTSRDEIIDASRTIIENEGIEQLTMRRLAQTVNRTQPAVYQHFSSKDALLKAVVTYGITALAERLKRAARVETTSLIAIADAYVRFGLERPELYEVMFVGPPVIAVNAATTPMSARSVLQIFAAAVGESGLEPAEVDTVAEVVWAALHGLVMFLIMKRLRPGRVLHRTRFKTLTAGIVAITASRGDNDANL